MGYPTGIDPVLPVSQTSVQATTLRTPLAGDVRIELTTLESKSSVIPLHQSPTVNLYNVVKLFNTIFVHIWSNSPSSSL